MDIAHFLETVAENGFTRACEIFKISRSTLKEMCDYILKNSDHQITPYTTKLQILYYYCSVKLNTEGVQVQQH